MNNSNLKNSIGLEHLMKAASALTELTTSATSNTTVHVHNHHHVPISDDDTASATTSSQSRSSSSSSSSSYASSWVPQHHHHNPTSSGSNGTVSGSSGSNHNSGIASGSSSSNNSTTANTSSSAFTTNAPTVLSNLSQSSSIHSTMAKDIFPQRLMRILSQPEVQSIITWLPHGRSFVIIKPEELADQVLPKYFPESCVGENQKCKYPSFTRKLNRWGFRQVTRGPDAGAFHHSLFLRDAPQLCLQMVCQRSKRRSSNDSCSNTMSVGGASAASTFNPHSLVAGYFHLDSTPGGNHHHHSSSSSSLKMPPISPGLMTQVYPPLVSSVLEKNVATAATTTTVTGTTTTTTNSSPSCTTTPNSSLIPTGMSHISSQLPYPYPTTSSLMHINHPSSTMANMNTVTSHTAAVVPTAAHTVSSTNTVHSIMKSASAAANSTFSSPLMSISSAPPSITTASRMTSMGSVGSSGNVYLSIPSEIMKNGSSLSSSSSLVPTATITNHVNTSSTTIDPSHRLSDATSTATNDHTTSSTHTATDSKEGSGSGPSNEERIANAKNLLYDAYLKALG